MLLVPASLYVFSWVHRVAPAVVAADLMRAFSITAAALGNLAAIYPYVFAAMALVAGGLTDTLGPRWTLALGGATMGLGAAVFGGASPGVAPGAAGLIRARPEGMGFPPVNPEHARRSVPTLREVLRGVPEVMRNPRTWPPILATCGIYSTFITFLGLWGVPYLTQVYGLTRVQIGRAHV